MVINGQIYALRCPGCSEGRVIYDRETVADSDRKT